MANGLLKVKDNQWQVDPALDTFDPSVGLPKKISPARMRWDARMEHDPMNYFNVFFPRRLIEHLAEWSNEESFDLKEQVTVMGVDKYVACILAMTLQPHNNMKDYWKAQDDSFRSGGDFFKKTRMSQSAFDDVRKKISYGPKTAMDKSFEGF